MSTLDQLTTRCQALQYKNIYNLAEELKVPVPANLQRAKGWVGQLIERSLGATAGNLPQPDFPALGIELKTLPLNSHGNPGESTFVCTAPLYPETTDWQHSRVYKKLRHVLWVPIIDHIIQIPFFWQPTDDFQQILKTDWEELTEMLYCGDASTLSAKYGTYLQIRPKAANSRTLVATTDHYGDAINIVPRGFYLRASCTKLILQANTNFKPFN